MVVTTPKQSELIDKLLVIAQGDIDLVREALYASAVGSKTADLSKVVRYII